MSLRNNEFLVSEASHQLCFFGWVISKKPCPNEQPLSTSRSQSRLSFSFGWRASLFFPSTLTTFIVSRLGNFLDFKWTAE